jgi:hypothetical protein
MEHRTRYPAVAAVGLATAELMLALQQAFPQVRLVPCAPIAGEDMHVWAYLPMPAGEQLTVQDRLGAIAHRASNDAAMQVLVRQPPPQRLEGLDEGLQTGVECC